MDGGWWLGRLAIDPDAHAGSFPSNYVRPETPAEGRAADADAAAHGHGDHGDGVTDHHDYGGRGSGHG
jgi:hypothetical protein